MMLAAALAYARLGWRVVPLFEPSASDECSCPRHGTCDRPGKHPRITRWQDTATTDEAQIREWWKAWPNASIGIATGRGLLVVDLDGDEGEANWCALVGDRDLPRTPTVSTGRGHHLYLRTEDARTSKGALGAGIDTRGDGGYVVAPPSRHASGRRYAWVVAPGDGGLAPAPAWLLDALAPHPRAASAGPAGGSSTRGAGDLDVSDSGLDVAEAFRLLRAGATDVEVATALRVRASYVRRRARSERLAEDYLARTVAFARSRHGHGLTRVIVAGVYLDARPRLVDRPALALLRLTLATPEGEVLPARASVVVPTAGYDDAATRARYAAVASDLDPHALARGDSALARRLVGRQVLVALREGRVAWIDPQPQEKEIKNGNP